MRHDPCLHPPLRHRDDGVAGDLLMVAPADARVQKRYKNCAKLNAVYPHGVGKHGARDKTSGTPVTDFRVNRAVYAKNTGLDRDHDGIACEKK